MNSIDNRDESDHRLDREAARERLSPPGEHQSGLRLHRGHLVLQHGAEHLEANRHEHLCLYSIHHHAHMQRYHHRPRRSTSQQVQQD